jgi:hypothetical protein
VSKNRWLQLASGFAIPVRIDSTAFRAAELLGPKRESLKSEVASATGESHHPENSTKPQPQKVAKRHEEEIEQEETEETERNRSID